MTNNETIRAVGREKRIPHEFRETVTQGYDLLFVILSESYLLSVADALTDIPNQTTAFAAASNGSKHLIGDCHWIPATDTEHQALETTWMELRGREFCRIASVASSLELEALVQDPERAADWVHSEEALESRA